MVAVRSALFSTKAFTHQDKPMTRPAYEQNSWSRKRLQEQETQKRPLWSRKLGVCFIAVKDSTKYHFIYSSIQKT